MSIIFSYEDLHCNTNKYIPNTRLKFNQCVELSIDKKKISDEEYYQKYNIVDHFEKDGDIISCKVNDIEEFLNSNGEIDINRLELNYDSMERNSVLLKCMKVNKISNYNIKLPLTIISYIIWYYKAFHKYIIEEFNVKK